jgi:predicted transposase YbfD/YdcC
VAADATEDMADLSVYESVVFLEHFKEMDDPRQSGKVRYPLDEILLLCLAAVISGAKTVSAIAQFGEMKLMFLRRFKPFKDGTPAHDHLGDILASLDPEAFQCCFVAWVSALIGAPVEAIAIDGKTQRRSGSKAKGQAAAHIVTAFAARQRLVLAQVKVDAKSNEITAIPALIGMIDMTGAVVTIDAMGCQRVISEQIVEKKADYVLALKGNQSALHDDVKTFVDEQKTKNFADTTVSRSETVDGDHGRIETRKFTVIHDVEWLLNRHKWPGLKGIVVVESRRESGDKVETETRLFITSSAMDAERLGPFVRGHWAVENSLHWVLDMVFRDDECRMRTQNAPLNFATIKHIATNLLRKAPGKGSMLMKCHKAAWDDDFRASIFSSAHAA